VGAAALRAGAIWLATTLAALGVFAGIAGIPPGPAAFAAPAYALTWLAALVLVRGGLDMVQAEGAGPRGGPLGWLTTPFVRLAAPLTPRFLAEPAMGVYAAVCLYLAKVALFGIGTIPPPWAVLLAGPG
jgi:hypothetical protein